METLKQQLGFEAAEKVQDGVLVGLGTGSTTAFFIKALGDKFKAGQLQRTVFTFSSYSTWLLAKECGLPLIPLSEVSKVDLYVDGADEVDLQLNLIKGRGAAMVQEKILAETAEHFLILIDETKEVDTLCSNFPLPVEFLPASLASVQDRLQSLGGIPNLRFGIKKDGPVVSDQGFFIFDTEFKETQNWKKLDTKMNSIPGVLGHGLFLNDIVNEVWIASKENGITKKSC